VSLNIAYESDRGCIIVAAAFFDNMLEEVIRKHIKKFAISKSLEKSLFDLSGPISNFSSKISICRSFGLIDDVVYKDLMVLRKLRNSFAHVAGEASFLSADVRQKVRSMYFVRHCMQEKKIDRYAYEEEENDKASTPPKALKEWEVLSKGYLSYDKSMFCLAVSELEYYIEHYSVVGRPPQESLSERVKKAKQKING